MIYMDNAATTMRKPKEVIEQSQMQCSVWEMPAGGHMSIFRCIESDLRYERASSKALGRRVQKVLYLQIIRQRV